MPVTRGVCAASSSIFASRHSSFGQVRPLRMFSGQSQSPRHLRLHDRTRSQGPFLRRRYPASKVVRPCPTPARNRRSISTVEAATLVSNGAPPITRLTFPACRAHYPGGSDRCMCRLPPCPRGLPRYTAGSASALCLSMPAQASLTLRPTGSLGRPRRPLSRGFDPASYPTKPLVSYQINRQLSGWNLPPLVKRALGAHSAAKQPRGCITRPLGCFVARAPRNDGTLQTTCLFTPPRPCRRRSVRFPWPSRAPPRSARPIPRSARRR